MIRNVLTGVLVALVFVLAGCGETDETTGAISVESKKTVKQPIETPSEKLLGQSIEGLSDTDLLDQAPDRFSFRSLTGTPFLLSFIFTRCPDPGMCPLVTQKMQRLGRTDLAARIGLELVAVTIEPEYDTPAVLRTYAEERKLDPERWYLVTGPTRTIDNLTNQLHVSVLRENEGVKTHNMRTYFVDETGVIRDVWTGSDWEPSSVEESIHKRTESG